MADTSASALLGSLKSLQQSKVQAQPEPDPAPVPDIQIPNPIEASKRVRQFLEQQSVTTSTPAPTPQPVQEKRVVVQRGEDFVVEVREKRAVKKNFLMSPSIANSLADEAKSLGISQNELINQILKQRYL